MRPAARALLLSVVLAAACVPQAGSVGETERWEARAAGVRIVRDDWGVPHVYGETDADAVFGAMYAQAEDDFARIELNLLNAQGRLAEAEGEAEIWRERHASGDLRDVYFYPEDLEGHVEREYRLGR
jgi:acyl-homoserine-lactone acylase